MLLELGASLDGNKPLQVHNRGIVAMVDGFPFTSQAKENGNERQSKRRSAAGPRERSARRKGQTSGPRTPRSTPRFSGGELRKVYEEQVARLADAYPTLQTFNDKNGIWLLAGSEILSNLPHGATFLVALPFIPGAGPKAWGFWTFEDRFTWIGPRHTNFQDGSICAFSTADGAWSEGGDLRTLLDLYSVWVLRHLYFAVFGRWPGKQYALIGDDVRMQAYYRLVECKDDELCGCGSEDRSYADCCKQSDQQFDLAHLMSFFLSRVENGFASRCPPNSVTHFIEARTNVPHMVQVHVQLRQVLSHTEKRV